MTAAIRTGPSSPIESPSLVLIEDIVADTHFTGFHSPGSRRTLFIFRLAYASSQRIPLTHIGPTFGGAVIIVAAEMVDIRSSGCPDNSIRGAMHPCQRFRRILVDACLPLARAVESIRQARPTIALRRGGRVVGWGGPSTLTGSPRTREPIRQARLTIAL